MGKHRHTILLAAMVLWMAFIFINSSFSGDRSSGLSEAVVALILGITGRLGTGNFISGLREWIQSDGFHLFIRKSAHFVEFGVLGLLVTGWLGVFKTIRKNFLKRLGTASAICLMYAISDEVHQLFVKGRNGSLRDVLIDFAGALVFSAVLLIINNGRKKNIHEG